MSLFVVSFWTHVLQYHLKHIDIKKALCEPFSTDVPHTQPFTKARDGSRGDCVL